MVDLMEMDPSDRARPDLGLGRLGRGARKGRLETT
jgi:hypothetical protein